jgi:hypothetical protein
VLDALMVHQLPTPERTTNAIVEATGLSNARSVLSRLERRDPPLVRRTMDATLDIEIWFSAPEAAESPTPRKSRQSGAFGVSENVRRSDIRSDLLSG